MADMKNDISNGHKSTRNHRIQSSNREDEINLADYLRIISKRKYFIFSCSVLPALLVGIILFISPKNCNVTYTYDVMQDNKDIRMLADIPGNIENLNQLKTELEKDELSAKSSKILLGSFFDTENLNKLATKLRENGFDEYTKEISDSKIHLAISGTLLTMTINGSSRDNMQRISSIVRDNFETNLLTYAAKQELTSNISNLKTKINEFEQNKFNLEMELDSQKTLVTKLKNIASADSNSIRDGIVLHFDKTGENKAYLPWEYQARAAQANIIYCEEALRTNQKKNNHYKALIDLNEKLLNDIRNSTSLYNNAQEFHAFLINITGNYQNMEFDNYLNTYINKMDNAISAYTPLVENPKIYFIPKNILKKSVIVFLLLLIVAIFLALLLEVVPKNRYPTS